MKKKNKKLEQLKLLYLFALGLGTLIIVPTHISPPPTFMYARFPYYLEMMGPFLGISWPLSFEIYHYVLYTLIIIVSLNVFGIIFYPKLRSIAIFSSLIGIFLIFPMVLFFFFVFLSVNAPTAVIYGLYSVVLLIVNWLTFKALIIEPQPSQTRPQPRLTWRKEA